MLQDSRSEYAARMHRVLEHIDQHLDQHLRLERLAAIAFFSPFHFHRLFTAWTGETLGQYLRRRRLEVGAVRLLTQPSLSVLQVALAVGFGSPEAFARAFKASFGSSPSAWRTQERARRSSPAGSTLSKDRKLDQAVRNPRQAPPASIPYPGRTQTPLEGIMQVTLTVRPNIPVAYLRHIGPYGPSLLDFWQQQVYPWMRTNSLLGRPRLGICHDDPGITAPTQCRYDACVEVPQDLQLAGAHLRTVLPGGKVAALRFRGTAMEAPEAWASLLRDWLPASGLQLDARPFYEYYAEDARFDPATGVFECQLCAPVKPL